MGVCISSFNVTTVTFKLLLRLKPGAVNHQSDLNPMNFVTAFNVFAVESHI